MAYIRIDVAHTVINGSNVSFKAPCNCTEVKGLKAYFPNKKGAIINQVFTFTDAHGNDLTGVGNLFQTGAIVKAILNVDEGKAYLQNADTNKYLENKFGQKADLVFGKIPAEQLPEVDVAVMDYGNVIVEKIDTSQTWVAPKATKQWFKVFAVGGGGGGGCGDSYSGGGGGGGGYVEIRELTIQEGASIDIVCGAGGTSGITTGTNGTAGGTTYFGNYFSAAGGKGGTCGKDEKGGNGGDGGAGGGAGGGNGDSRTGNGGNGGKYGGGGGGYIGGNGGKYGGGGGSCYPYGGGAVGKGGEYGGDGGMEFDEEENHFAEDGTATKFVFHEHLGKTMTETGIGQPINKYTQYSSGYGGGGYGGNGGAEGGGGGYGGNGGAEGYSGNSGGGNYGGNGGSGYANYRGGGGGGGGLFCNGGNGTISKSSEGDGIGGGGGGIVSGGSGSLGGGNGGCYILYYMEKELMA